MIPKQAAGSKAVGDPILRVGKLVGRNEHQCDGVWVLTVTGRSHMGGGYIDQGLSFVGCLQENALRAHPLCASCEMKAARQPNPTSHDHLPIVQRNFQIDARNNNVLLVLILSISSNN